MGRLGESRGMRERAVIRFSNLAGAKIKQTDGGEDNVAEISALGEVPRCSEVRTDQGLCALLWGFGPDAGFFVTHEAHEYS